MYLEKKIWVYPKWGGGSTHVKIESNLFRKDITLQWPTRRPLFAISYPKEAVLAFVSVFQRSPPPIRFGSNAFSNSKEDKPRSELALELAPHAVLQKQI